jgi:hypothetical protein
MVNVVALVVGLLRPALNFYAEVPANEERPVGRIEEAGGIQPSSLMPGRLTTVDLQLTTWGTTKSEAWQLLADAVETLREAPRVDPTHSQGVLTRVEPLGVFYLPDVDWPANGRPGPRYEMTVRIVAHG